MPLKREDFNCRLYQLGAVNPYEHVYENKLTREFYPKPGENTVKVALVKRDRGIRAEFVLYDVDLAINYLVQRNFRKDPIDY